MPEMQFEDGLLPSGRVTGSLRKAPPGPGPESEFRNVEYRSLPGRLEHAFCKRTRRKATRWI